MITRKKGHRQQQKISKEEIKTNFFFMLKEILSSNHDICQGVDRIADENKISHNSRKNRCRLVDLIIKRRADISKGIGIAANAPSVIPGAGVIGTTAFTAAVEFISLIRLQIEMCLAIAYVHGKDLDHDRLLEALGLIGWLYDPKNRERLDKLALKSGVKKAVKSYTKKGLLLMMERIVTRIQLAAVRNGLSRFVPFLGMPIAAGMNYREVMSVGRLAKMYYG